MAKKKNAKPHHKNTKSAIKKKSPIKKKRPQSISQRRKSQEYTNKKKKWFIPAIAAAGVVVIAIGIWLVITFVKSSGDNSGQNAQTAAAVELDENQIEWQSFLPNVAPPEQGITYLEELSSENIKVFEAPGSDQGISEQTGLLLGQAQHFGDHVSYGGFVKVSEDLAEDGSYWTAVFQSEPSEADTTRMTITTEWTSSGTLRITAEKGG